MEGRWPGYMEDAHGRRWVAMEDADAALAGRVPCDDAAVERGVRAIVDDFGVSPDLSKAERARKEVSSSRPACRG